MASAATLTEQNDSMPPTRQQQVAMVKQDIDRADEPEAIMPGLTRELEKKLIQLAKEFEMESWSTFRWFARDFLEAESFW